MRIGGGGRDNGIAAPSGAASSIFSQGRRATRSPFRRIPLRKLFAHRLASEAQGSEPRGLFPQCLLARLVLRHGFVALDPRFFFSLEKRFSPLAGVLRTHRRFFLLMQ